jgi:hypothetical protein
MTTPGAARRQTEILSMITSARYGSFYSLSFAAACFHPANSVNDSGSQIAMNPTRHE